jgi:transposase
MTRQGRYPQELRERAVRLVLEPQGEHASQWAAICSIAAKFGISHETLRHWVRRAENDEGSRAGLTSDERERLKTLERENRELRRADEILKSAAAFSGQGRPLRAAGGRLRPGNDTTGTGEPASPDATGEALRFRHSCVLVSLYRSGRTRPTNAKPKDVAYVVARAAGLAARSSTAVDPAACNATSLVPATCRSGT